MKKWLCGMLSVLFILCCTSACAQTHQFNGAFEIEYPDAWELDPNFGVDSSTEDFRVLGAFETYASVLELCISDDRAYYDDFTLPLVMNSEYYAYLADVMSVLEQSDETLRCEFVKAVADRNGKAMFLIFYVDDGDGGYYYADTMIGGCTLLVYAYSDHKMLDTGARQLAELETLITEITFNDNLFQ